MHKLLLGKHVSSWSPAGVGQQSQDKQVPVLRLFSVSEAFVCEPHTSLPFCGVHGKYKMCVFTQRVKLNTVQWRKLKRNKETQEFLFRLSCLSI